MRGQRAVLETGSVPPPIWLRLYSKLREVGPLYLAQLTLQRAFVPRLFEVDWRVIVAMDLRILPQGVADGDIREATTNDIDRFVAFGERADVIRNRLRNGQRGWVVERNGCFLGYDWLGLPLKTISPWLFIEGSEGDVWGHFIKIRNDCRGTGLGPRLRRHVAQECARAGYTRMLGTIDGLNRNSQSALSKAGFGPLGTVFFVSLLGLTLVRHGRRWRLGFWSADQPLQISVADTVVPGGLH